MSDPIQSADPNAEGWDACEPGTLGGLNTRLRAEDSRRRLAPVASGVLAVAVALVAFAFWPAPSSDLGGLACHQCLELMPAYHDQLVDSKPMPAEQFEAVTQHLAWCQKCHTHFEAVYPGVLPALAAAGIGLASLAVRPRRRA